MKRKVLWVNLILIALAAVLAWRLRETFIGDRYGERVVLEAPARVRAILAPPPPPPFAIPSAAQYIDIAQKTLFSRDRNPNVVVEPPPPPPKKEMPPLPRFYGVMSMFGDSAILLSAGREGQKLYRNGDPVGPFKLIDFDNQKVTFDWDGEKVERSFTDLAPTDKDAGQAQAPAQQPAPAAAAPRSVSSLSSPAAAAPDEKESSMGVDIGGGFRACNMNDSQPAGAVVGNFKKVVTQTMAGPSCHWEPIK